MADIDVVVVCDQGDAHGLAITAELDALGVSSFRYNLSDLRSTPLLLQPGEVSLGSSRISSATTIWWRRAGIAASADLDAEEAQLARDESPHVLKGAFSAVGARWVDDPADVERAELKLYQLSIAARLGTATPTHRVTNVPDLAREFAASRRLVAKPLSPGRGIAPFVAELEIADLDRTAALPVLMQELMVNATSDLRVVTIGTHVWTWRRERDARTIDWRAEDPHGVAFTPHDHPDVETAAARITSALRLTMSVQDWLETPDGPVFLEANPQGAWLFLDGARTTVAPALAKHLAERWGPTSAGTWPRALKRIAWDFLPAKHAPNNDGTSSPDIPDPLWASAVAVHPEAIAVARRAHDEAKSAAKIAEEKGSRLAQTGLALLTVTLAVGAFQANFIFDRSSWWLFSAIPILGALAFLSLATFEAVQIDRVGFYNHPSPADLLLNLPQDPAATIIAKEETGRLLALWTANHKHSDLMQARAWFTRGLASLILAAALAVTCRAVDNASAPDGGTPTTTTTR